MTVPLHTWLFAASIGFATLTVLAILFGTSNNLINDGKIVHVTPAWQYTIAFAFLTALWALYALLISV